MGNQKSWVKMFRSEEQATGPVAVRGLGLGVDLPDHQHSGPFVMDAPTCMLSNKVMFLK